MWAQSMYTVAEGRRYWRQEGNSRPRHWLEARLSTWQRSRKSPLIQAPNCAKCSEDVHPPQNIAPKRKLPQRIPMRRFKYDAYRDRVKCPAGKLLERKGRSTTNNGYMYRTRSCDCKTCPLRKHCISPTAHVRQILIVDGYTALLRARRQKERGWTQEIREKYTRHCWRVEGVHGRAKTQHGLARAVGRGIENVSTQAYLTAIAMNLKKLASMPPILEVFLTTIKCFRARFSRLLGQWRQKVIDINKWIINWARPFVLT